MNVTGRDGEALRQSGADKCFVVFSDDWGRHPSSCQHIFRYICRQFQVVWINTVGLRTPKLSFYDLKRAFQVFNRWAGRNGDGNQGKAPDTGPEVLSPVMFPSFRPELLNRTNQLLLERAVRQALARVKAESAILISTLPLVPRIFKSGLFARTIYYCVDDFTLWPGVDGEITRRLESETLQACDALIATSDRLLVSRGAHVQRSLLLTHGVDFLHFNKSCHGSPLSEIAGLPRPVLGMFGVFDARTDGELLERLAKSFPEGSIVIIGPVDRDKRPFEALGNIHFFNAVPYDELPAWISGFDVCILPYEINNLARAINPLKLKEYLATGKPVVSTPLPEVLKLAPYLTAADRDEFVSAVRSAVCKPPGVSTELQKMLHNESWERKAGQFLQFALEGL
jgi:glycosyltransferase involved in cell wall biosynthesis